MSLSSLVSQLVEERSLEALEKLTGSRREEVYEALIEAVAEIIGDERADESDDEIIDEVRAHLVDNKASGPLVDALRNSDPLVKEFSLSCLSEIGDYDALPEMIALLKDRSEQVREAAAAHLALLTKYDFGLDAKKWREWYQKRVQGLVEQAEEDREDEARRLKLRMRGKNAADKEADEYASEDSGRFSR